MSIAPGNGPVTLVGHGCAARTSRLEGSAALSVAGARVGVDSSRMIVDQALKDATAELAATAGFVGELGMQRLRVHGQNRVFRVDVGGATLLLKRYFPGTGERRDRLRAEFSFSRFAWSQGVRVIPEPIAADYTRHMALFAFVEGTRAAAAPVTAAAIAAAVAFIAHINRDRAGLSARALPLAFGGLFSIAEHIAAIGSRLIELRERAEGLHLDSFACELIDARLRPAWASVAATLGDCPDPPAAERCLSPSDFGFHNAIIDAAGQLVFHDFEYAGWDDPARIVAELFAQPQVPIARQLFMPFAQGIGAALGLSQGFAERAARLLPLYRVYNCCALLTEILPADGSAAKRKRRRENKDARWAAVQQAIADLHEHEGR